MSAERYVIACGCVYEAEPGRTALMERCAEHKQALAQELLEEFEADDDA